jgi:hypothetical protein
MLALGIGKSIAADEAATFNKRYSIKQQDQTFWLVKPNGERFFSLGVCCVNQGATAKEWDPANPGYAAWQHYADSNQWAVATLGRLKAWGFTTVGGWSAFETLKECRDAD